MQLKRPTGDMLRASTPTMILAVLDQNPSGLHGYAIVQKIEELSKQKFKLGQASVYPVLHTLLEVGMVEIEFETPPRGPVRKVYKLTESGRDEFSHLKEALVADMSTVQIVINGGHAGVKIPS